MPTASVKRNVSIKRSERKVTTKTLFEKNFEANYEHRKKIEVARKTKDEESRLAADYNFEKKNEKLEMLRKRQEDNKVRLDKRNMSLDKRWRNIKKKPATFADGNFSFYEPVV